MPVTGTAITATTAGINSTACDTQPTDRRSTTATMSAPIAVTIHPRDVSEAATASSSEGLPTSAATDTPESLAACTSTIASAVRSQIGATRSANRCTAKACWSMRPRRSGLAVTTMWASAPRHRAPASAAVK